MTSHYCFVFQMIYSLKSYQIKSLLNSFIIQYSTNESND